MKSIKPFFTFIRKQAHVIKIRCATEFEGETSSITLKTNVTYFWSFITSVIELIEKSETIPNDTIAEDTIVEGRQLQKTASQIDQTIIDDEQLSGKVKFQIL